MIYKKLENTQGNIQKTDKNKKLTGLIIKKTELGIEIKENYINGKKNGESLMYFSKSGKIIEKCFYINDLKDGELVRYALNGNIIYKGSYCKGKKKGIWTEYYDNGNLKSKKSYLNNNSELITELYENGNLKSENKDNSFYKYFEDGTISYIKKIIYDVNDKKRVRIQKERFFSKEKLLIKECFIEFDSTTSLSKGYVKEFWNNGNVKIHEKLINGVFQKPALHYGYEGDFVDFN